MAFKVTDFINQAQDGARPSLFLAQVNFPSDIVGGSDAGEKSRFLIKSTSIPSSTLGIIELPFMGRKIKIAGDRTFEDWSTTVINDEKFTVRAAIEKWSDGINGLQSNAPTFSKSIGYRTSSIVTQFSARGNPIRTYTFHNVWPSTVASMELGWETTDAIEEFEVTWTYDYYTVTQGSDGVKIDIGVDIGKSITAALGLTVTSTG